MAKSTGSRAILIGGGLLWALSQGVQAETNLTIRAVIIAPPPCVINSGSTLDVPFGNDLLTSRVDGVNYRRDVPYTVICDSPFNNAMKLELKGTGASFPGTRRKTGRKPSGCSKHRGSGRRHAAPSARFRAGRCSGRCCAGR